MKKTISHPKKMLSKANDEPIDPHVLRRKITTINCHKFETIGNNKRSCKENRH